MGVAVFRYKPYLWTTKFEVHIIDEYSSFDFFSQLFKKVKAIFSSEAMRKPVAGWMRPSELLFATHILSAFMLVILFSPYISHFPDEET